MKSLSSYDFILFDFDGLLVDTEPLHYAAYMLMCARRGYSLEWSFEKFCHVAHAEASGFFKALRTECPALFASGVSEQVLYEEKKCAYVELLKTEPFALMPGVAALLDHVHSLNKPCAVVTNSPRAQIELIQSRLPLLERIPLWITREDYTCPKPSPEGYELAISQLSCKRKRGIGFEDSLKGLKALISAGVEAVLVCPSSYAGVSEALQRGASHINTFNDMPR